MPTSKRVSYKEISNGYLICEDIEGPSGYEYRETYVPNEPKIVFDPDTAPQPKNSMQRAVEAMNRVK